jgi:nitrogen fixation protein NifU and related proteins
MALAIAEQRRLKPPLSERRNDMSELTDLYQEVILDHNRRPHNFRVIEPATAKQEGYNPLCGDRLTLYLTLDGDVIKDAAFQGIGCAISKASASLMTAAVKGKTRAEADAIFARFHAMVLGQAPGTKEELGQLVVFSGVSRFPVRVKCASLAWHTLKAALASEGAATPVSTE